MLKAILKTAGGLFLVLFVFGIIESAVNPKPEKAAQAAEDKTSSDPLDIEYEVIKDQPDRYKRSVEIVLKERISEEQLAALAKHLYQDHDGNTFMGYYIEGEGNYAYWATTHYDPDMTVRIIGSDQAQEPLFSNSDENADDPIIGRWRVNRGYNSVITLTEVDGEKRLIQRFQDGSKMDNPVQERTVNGQTRISDGIGESNGEYYIIGNDGWLQFWSDNGNYYTAPIDK